MQTCYKSGKLALTHLELGVLLVDKIQATLATNDLAIRSALFDRGSYFHSSMFVFFYLYLNEILPLVKS